MPRSRILDNKKGTCAKQAPSCEKCRKWCGREDSNFHGFYPTATSTLRVYQFRHGRTIAVHGCKRRVVFIKTPNVYQAV